MKGMDIMAKEFKMSQKRYEELRAELEYAKTIRADEIAELIKEARGFGDLSENSEYDEAKNEQGKLYSRIAELEEILIDLYRGESVEKVYVLSFDAEDRLVSVDIVGEGTVNYANIIPRKIADAVFKCSAVSAVVAHNHPTGIAAASRDDLEFTAGVIDILRGVGVELAAHYTVAGNHCERIM